jgi:acyl-coenzyme A thioesterase PaaI-like protein
MSKASKLRRLMNWWPPFIGAGITVETISEDFRHVRVGLRIGLLNRNYVGTHFGGSLFAMTDPYWMIMILENLGSDYLVWDKAAEIEFVRAVKEPVWCEFRLNATTLDEIRAAAASGEKHLRWMPVEIVTASGDVVARVRKQIYVRLKERERPR